jgi:hypothetical protein
VSDPIQPTIDAYGRYARASNLADHLELLALQDQPLSRTALADLISDRTWVAKLDELFEGGALRPRGDFEEPDEEEDSGTGEEQGVTQAGRVFDVLEERSDLLGEMYPFLVDDELRIRHSFATTRESPYVALLAITLAHAHGVDTDHDPKRVLEDVVVAALEARGLAAVNVGAISREGHAFHETVRRSGVALGLRPTPEAAVTLTHAKEEGVDALAHLPWEDRRTGAWIFLGQATCGKSDGWSAKMAEPKPETWRLMLNSGIRPLPFLAVPHHVESMQWAKLVQDRNGIVLDRVRLTRFHGDLTPAETSIIESVLSVGVEALA